MSLIAITIAILMSVLAVLAYVVLAASRTEAALAAISKEHSEAMRKLERDLDRARASIDSLGAKAMPCDLRQRARDKDRELLRL